jgi:lipopolysaccharide export system permease protein
MIKIIDRYIARELIKPFFMVIMAFIVVMISIRLGDDIESIIRDKIPPLIVIKTIIYKIPDYIVQSLPIAYLMATLLTTSRFSRDHETTALRSAGIKFKRLMIPIIILSVIISYCGFIINEYIVPISIKESQKAVDEFARYKKQGLINNNVYFRGLDNKFFHVQRIDRDRQEMENIVIADIDLNKERVNILAKKGNWQNTNWKLIDGVVHYYKKNSPFVYKEEKFNVKFFDSKIKIDEILEEQKNPGDLSIKRLKELIDIRKSAGFEARELEVEYYLKYARPFATFFSATISAPLGFIFARLGNYIGVALSIILIFIYYVAESIGRSIGLNGLVPPLIASWTSNVVFAINGLILLWQVDKR